MRKKSYVCCLNTGCNLEKNDSLAKYLPIHCIYHNIIWDSKCNIFRDISKFLGNIEILNLRCGYQKVKFSLFDVNIPHYISIGLKCWLRLLFRLWLLIECLLSTQIEPLYIVHV